MTAPDFARLLAQMIADPDADRAAHVAMRCRIADGVHPADALVEQLRWLLDNLGPFDDEPGVKLAWLGHAALAAVRHATTALPCEN